MTFQNLQWLWLAVPLLLLMVVIRFWRRNYWGHSLVENAADRLGALRRDGEELGALRRRHGPDGADDGADAGTRRP